MIKKTLYFGNPAYLSLRLGQIVIRKTGSIQVSNENDTNLEEIRTIPIEDVGIIVLDNKQITITQALLNALLGNNCSIVSCDDKHMPTGLFLPLEQNTLQCERFRDQIEASLPLKKQLWQQTVIQKIRNQSAALRYATGESHKTLEKLSSDVRSGDPDNFEGRAAAYYWKNIFPDIPDFVRGRDETFPNVLLNYGYGILRAIISRALVASGLLPTLGIHHHNRYNAYCLADDIMEPYRPYVDKLVVDILFENPFCELSPTIKAKLLSLPTMEVIINGKRSPLMLAASTTTASLYKCFSGESRKILYPEM